jgi:SAM-dependent methyltransferase
MEYVGQELELFATAHNWKSYLRDRIRPYLGERVLEVGAGIGGTTRLLVSDRQAQWVCLEPDPSLAAQLSDAIGAGALPDVCSVRTGVLGDLPADEKFDSIIYIDVLEHIEADAEELTLAADHAKPGGHVIVLSPAHQWLFSEFDESLGHFRRYSAGTLRRAAPESLIVEKIEYMDSIGVIASGANRLLLRKSMPGTAQIAFWDRIMVPVSRVIDPLFGHRLGKSILAVWKRARS